MRHAAQGGASLAILLVLIVLLLGAGGLAFAYQGGYVDLSGTGLDKILSSVGLAPSSGSSPSPSKDQLAATTPRPAQPATTTGPAPASQGLLASGGPPLLQPETVSRVTLTVSSDPEGVEIYVDGEFAGVAPLPMVYPQNAAKTVTLTFKKEGYIDAEQKINLERDVPIIARLAPVAEGASLRESDKTLPKRVSVKTSSLKKPVKKSPRPTAESKTKVKNILEGRSQ